MRRRPSLAGRIARLLLVGLALLWSCFPILLVVISSFKEPRRIFETPPSLIFPPTLQNYERLWLTWPEFFTNMGNSLVITVGAVTLTIVVACAAGYVYARYSNRLLTGSAFFMIVVRMLPPIVIALPLFPAANWLGLHDTHILLVLLYATFFVSLATWIMRAFIAQLPRELEEAALVDGAGLFATLIRIVLPLAAQGIVAAAIFVAVFAWNEYVFALVFTTRDAKTTPLAVAEMLGTAEGVEWGVLFAAATLQLLPLVILVILLQRFIIAGLTAGSVKS